MVVLIESQRHGEKEENDSIYKLFAKFSSICGSYSQIITCSHRLFKLVCIVMENVQHLYTLEG